MDDLQVRQQKLDEILRWSPEFERGYDWGTFYAHNSVPPVFCHGTRSINIDRIRKYGFLQEEANPMQKVFDTMRGIIMEVCPLGGSLFWFDEDVTLFEAASPYLKESRHTFLTAAPGIAWNYAHIGGETIQRYLSSFARPMLKKIKGYTSSQKVSNLEKNIDTLQQECEAGSPALILVQTSLDKLYTTPFHSNNFFFDREVYERVACNLGQISLQSKGDLLCAQARYIQPEGRFLVPLTDEEEYTLQPIPPTDIIDIIS